MPDILLLAVSGILTTATSHNTNSSGGRTRLNKDNLGLEVNPDLGWHTVAFINYYCRRPEHLLTRRNYSPLPSTEVRYSLIPKTFLRTHSLNQDLYNFLVTVGYPKARLGFILKSPKIMPREGGRSENQKWQNYYSPELKKYVRERERLLFELFHEFGSSGPRTP